LKTVLVTGATGFVAANLIRRLIDMPYDLYTMSRPQSKIWRIKDIYNSLINYEVDIRDETAVTSAVKEIEPDVILHLATHGAYPRTQKDFDTIMDTNITGTHNLLNACAKLGFNHFIYTGSSSEYGVKDKPMKENDEIEPIDTYGISKATATTLCRTLALNDKLPITILRLFSVYGYYEAPTRLIPTLIRAQLKNEMVSFFEPYAVRDFIFIEDVVDVLANMIEKPTTGEIFNVGFGEQHSVTEVLKIIMNLTDTYIFQFDKLDERREPKTWVSDNTKLKQFLNWQPKFSLEAGLKKTVEWFKSNPQFMLPEGTSG